MSTYNLRRSNLNYPHNEGSEQRNNKGKSYIIDV